MQDVVNPSGPRPRLRLADVHTLELVVACLRPADVVALARADRAMLVATREAAARGRRVASVATLLTAAHRAAWDAPAESAVAVTTFSAAHDCGPLLAAGVTSFLVVALSRGAFSAALTVWRRPLPGAVLPPSTPRLWAADLGEPRERYDSPTGIHATDSGLAVTSPTAVDVFRWRDVLRVRGDGDRPARVPLGELLRGGDDGGTALCVHRWRPAVHLECRDAPGAPPWRVRGARLHDPDVFVLFDGGRCALFDAFTGREAARFRLCGADTGSCAWGYDGAMREVVLCADGGGGGDAMGGMLRFALDSGVSGGGGDGCGGGGRGPVALADVVGARVAPTTRGPFVGGAGAGSPLAQRARSPPLLLWCAGDALPAAATAAGMPRHTGNAPARASVFPSGEKCGDGSRADVLVLRGGAVEHYVHDGDVAIATGAAAALGGAAVGDAAPYTGGAARGNAAFAAAGAVVFVAGATPGWPCVAVAGRQRHLLPRPATPAAARAAPAAHVRYVPLHTPLPLTAPWRGEVAWLAAEDPVAERSARAGVFALASDGLFLTRPVASPK